MGMLKIGYHDFQPDLKNSPLEYPNNESKKKGALGLMVGDEGRKPKTIEINT